MKIRNRGKKSGKISDKAKTYLCLGLVFAGLVIIVCFSLLQSDHVRTGVSGKAYTYPIALSVFSTVSNGTADINSDDPDDLIMLPGIGESTARMIIDEHMKNGPFFYPEDLLCVRGIGNKKLAVILPFIDLSASEKGE